MTTDQETVAEAAAPQASAVEAQPAATGVLLGREHDVTAFASSDPKRAVLNAVHYSARHSAIEATNGKVLIRVPVTARAEEFPPVADTAPATDCLIPLAPFKRALANVPESTHLPILAHMRLEVAGSKCTLTTTDLDTEQAVRAKLAKGKYPNTDEVWPAKAPDFSITLSGDLLKVIAEYAIRHARKDSAGNHAIRFDFNGSLEAVRFSIALAHKGVSATGVLMPMRP